MADLAPLSERIATALTGTTTSAAVSALISEASAAATALQSRLNEAERISLDPLAADNAVEAASAEVVRLGLAIRRQQSALQRLDLRAKAVAADEQRVRQEAARVAAEKLRNEAVAAMRERYPVLAAELAALMRQALVADAAVRAADAGASVELTLRPLMPGETPGYYAPLTQMLHLPNFEARNGLPIWNGRTMG